MPHGETKVYLKLRARSSRCRLRRGRGALVCTSTLADPRSTARQPRRECTTSSSTRRASRAVRLSTRQRPGRDATGACVSSAATGGVTQRESGSVRHASHTGRGVLRLGRGWVSRDVRHNPGGVRPCRRHRIIRAQTSPSRRRGRAVRRSPDRPQTSAPAVAFALDFIGTIWWWRKESNGRKSRPRPDPGTRHPEMIAMRCP